MQREISYQNQQQARAAEVAKSASRGDLKKRRNSSIEDEVISNQYVLGVAFWSFFGFTLLQTGFAIKARSSAMLADSEAMFVDAATYLFNMLAERLKNREYTDEENALPAHVRVYQRKLHRLYLELLPPFISVTTLLVVTFFAMDGALQTLWTQQANSSNPTLSIMLFFSALNLLLDGVNVIFFARAHQAVLTPVNFDKELPIPSERMPFLPEGLSETQNSTVEDLDDDDLSQESGPLVNLNMCSAWTHVFADTLRSVAVLIAAGVAKLFAVITPDEADALAALLVSLVILLSCVPLIQGLFHTAREIRILHQQGLGEVVLSV